MHGLYNLVWHDDKSSNNTKPRVVDCFRGRACLKAVAGIFAFLAAPQAVADLYISQSGMVVNNYGVENVIISALGDAGLNLGPGSTKNIIMGSEAGANLTGVNNISFGQWSGVNLVGDENVGIGQQANAYSVTSHSTSVGQGTGEHQYGTANTSLGWNAGRSVSGNSNLALGVAAGSRRYSSNRCRECTTIASSTDTEHTIYQRGS